VWVVPVTGGTPRQLTVDVRDEDHGVYSPDGRWIAYHSERGGQWDIWIVPAAGGDAVRATNDAAIESPPEWTPDSGALLFRSEDISTRLYAVPASGGGPRLLSAADQRDEELHVSPDGKTVVHVQQHAGLGELWLTPIAGGESRPLVRGSENSDPRWSPDGSMIAFDSRRGTHWSVWVVNVSTGEEHQVSPPGLSTGLVDWSPDGTRVLILEGAPPRIIFVPVTGGDATTIADLDGFPVPSPNGETLAFARSFGEGDRGIYVISSTGGSATLLTAGQRMESAPPAWSSDSRRIAYNVFSEDGGTIDVYVMNADGSGRRRLTNSPAVELAPRWSADDSEIFYRDGAERLSAVNVATGEIRTVFEGDPAIVGVVVVSSDGETLVFSGSTARSEIMRVDVRDLLRERR
jgi:Tol biopolymer transport system component